MFREMRRFKQKLTEEEALQVLDRNTSGVLAVMGDSGYPYAVPLSYVLDVGKAAKEGSLDYRIFFHCARTGHKLDAIASNDKASFCVIDQDIIVPEKYTTYFRSVIAFGRARVLTEESEIRLALELLAKKYSPQELEGLNAELEAQIERVSIIEMKLEHLSGKEAIELKKG